ncbi:MAG TPA: ATP-dependent Clp protease ATP-binding subunit, partial [Cytophagaceae bacterium]
IGSEFIIESFKNGEVPKNAQMMEIMANYFRPEFLARLTEIVPFAPISEKVVLDIFNIHLKDLFQAMEKKGIALEIEGTARQYLSNLGYTPKYGARPLKGVIRDKIRRPLSRMIISEEIKKGDKILLSIDSDSNLEWKINY